MRQKKGTRGSLLDLFLIFLLLFCIFGTFLRHQSLHRDEEVNAITELRVEMLLQAVDPRMVGALSPGETLYRDSGEAFGVLVSIEQSATPITLIENGASVTGEWDERICCDLRLTVAFSGVEIDGRVLHSGTRPLSVGQSVICYSERAALQLKILRFLPVSPEIGD